MLHRLTAPLATLLVLTAAAPAALADAPAVAEAGEDDGAIGLDVDLGFATAYILRGLNVFQQEGQMDANMLLAPGVLWSIGDSGVSIGYLGFFQLTGDNISANIKGALGAEQDLYVIWSRGLADDLSLDVGLTAYLYPLADADVVGASFPVYLEPLVKLSYASVVDLALGVSYFLGIQDQPAIRGLSYLYLNPSVGKHLELGGAVGLDLKFAYGFKLFQEGNDGMSNVHDLLLAAALPISLGETYYLTPGLLLAWTNIEGKDFADGLAFVGTLNLGAHF